MTFFSRHSLLHAHMTLVSVIYCPTNYLFISSADVHLTKLSPIFASFQQNSVYIFFRRPGVSTPAPPHLWLRLWFEACWKALTELLLVIIELFSLAPTVEPLRANIEWRFLYHEWYKNLGATFVRFVTIHACDGQTDGQTPLP